MTAMDAPTRGPVVIPSGRPPWRKAPTRLFRRPALFAALALGGILVTLTAAAAPLFVAASESELLTSTIADPILTRYRVGIMYHATHVPFSEPAPDGGSLTQERGAAFAAEAARSPVLGPTLASFAAPPVFVTGVGGADGSSPPISGRLFAGDEALDHVQIIAGSPGEGVWLPDLIASAVGARPGDEVELHDGARSVRVHVDGIFQAVYSAPPDGYWQPWYLDFALQCVDCVLPAQFMITDRDQLMDIQRHLRRPESDQAWQAPVRAEPELTVTEARELATFAEDLEGRMQGGSDPASLTPLGALFRCCGRVFGPNGLPTSESRFSSASDGVVTIMEQRAPSVRGPVSVLLIAGLAISFAAIAAAAVFAVASRPDETGLLRARGWGPARVGARTAVEAIAPIGIGAVAGYLSASTLILVFGPAGTVGAAAQRIALVGSAAVSAASVLLVGAVAGALFASSHEHKERLTRAVLWFPWELLAFAAAWALGRSLATSGGVVVAGAVNTPRAAVFLYPLTLALAVGILLARLAALLVARRARSGGGSRVSAGWLALRRSASSRRLGVVFVVATALAVAAFVSAQGLVASLRMTVDAKAKVFVGSDVQVQTVPGATTPSSFPLPITEVQRASQAGSFDESTGGEFDLLVVDPTTFGSAAYWNDAFSDESLSRLLGDLAPTDSGALPIVLVNGAGFTPSSVSLHNRDAPVEVVGRATSFPGMSSQRPMVVMASAAVQPAFGVDPYRVTSTYSTTEFWIRGDPGEVQLAVSGAGLQAYLVSTADEVADIPVVVAAVNTLLVLDVLGLVALLLVVLLAIVYLQARQRSRVVASALSGRMGIRPRVMRRALVIELGGLLLVALIAGGTVGIATLSTVLDAIAPLPSIPPSPIVVAPWVALIGATVVLAIAAAVGGRLADGVARRGSLGEVMRVAS